MGYQGPGGGGGGRRGGGYADDEMYEGGDAPGGSPQPAPGGQPAIPSAISSVAHPAEQVIDPTKEYIDIDEAEKNR